MKYSYAILASAVLAGCVGEAVTHEIYLADGKPGFTINCSGNYSSWNTCLSRAGSICGAIGYKEIERHDERGYYKLGVGNTDIRDNQSYSTHSRVMVIECNPPGTVATISTSIPAK